MRGSSATASTDEDIGGTGDFNGDGNTDILFQNSVSGARTIWLMNGTTPSSMVGLGTVDVHWEIENY